MLSLEVAYVWHASVYTREVLNGLERIGFLYPEQIIWNKSRIVLTRTHYWYQHEPCWYVRTKNAPLYGKAGQNAIIRDSPSPKFIMGGSDEDKFDHPTQKPMDVMRPPILNRTLPGEAVYDCFLGSWTTLMAAEQNGRVCYGSELDPKYVDVIVRRWQGYTGKQAVLEGFSLTMTSPCFFREVAARAEHRSCSVLEPAHGRHNLFEGGPAFALQHGDHLAGLAALLRRTGFRSRFGGLLRARACRDVGKRVVGKDETATASGRICTR